MLIWNVKCSHTIAMFMALGFKDNYEKGLLGNKKMIESLSTIANKKNSVREKHPGKFGTFLLSSKILIFHLPTDIVSSQKE